MALGAWLVLALVCAPLVGRVLQRVGEGTTVPGDSGTPGSRSGRVIDLSDEYVYLAVDLTEDEGWTSVSNVAGFVGVLQPRRGAARALFVRRAPSREVALHDLEIDLRDAPEVDLTETSRW